MRMRRLPVLLSAVMVCGFFFTGCTGGDQTESKKIAESSSDASSQKEDSADDKKDSSADDEKGKSLSDLKKDVQEKVDELSEEVKGEEGSDQEKEEKYHPGDVVAFGDFNITYKSIKKYKSDNEFIQPKKGFQYVKYVFSVKNTGKEDSFVGDFACYADGEKCDSAYVDDSDSDLLLTELSAGRKKSGSLVFEVPKNVKLKDLELEYENNSLWSDKKIIFLGK